MDVSAVIDIGSNTINLIIVKHLSEGFETLHFERIPAKLGAGGMQEGRLTDEAIHRGLEALKRHRTSCEIAQVQRLRVTATSAVRSATNGADFVSLVKEELDLDIEVITGDREAELICKGVHLSGLLEDGPALIMDIGGGSTEFILADEEQVFWMKSYDLGVTRLKERFNAGDPFTPETEAAMIAPLLADMEELWEVLKRFPVKRLIGASGSFNSISLMLAGGHENQSGSIYEQIEIAAYTDLSIKLRRLGQDKRAAIPGLVVDRVDTIPYSALLIDLVMNKTSIDHIYRTSYSLKEGLISEML